MTVTSSTSLLMSLAFPLSHLGVSEALFLLHRCSLSLGSTSQQFALPRVVWTPTKVGAALFYFLPTSCHEASSDLSPSSLDCALTIQLKDDSLWTCSVPSKLVTPNQHCSCHALTDGVALQIAQPCDVIQVFQFSEFLPKEACKPPCIFLDQILQQNGTLQTSTFDRQVYIDWWLLPIIQVITLKGRVLPGMQSLSLAKLGRTGTCSLEHTWHHHLACHIWWDGLLGDWDTFSGSHPIAQCLVDLWVSQTRYPEWACQQWGSVPSSLPPLLCTIVTQILLLIALDHNWHSKQSDNLPGWCSVVPWGSSQSFSASHSNVVIWSEGIHQCCLWLFIADASPEPSPECHLSLSRTDEWSAHV